MAVSNYQMVFGLAVQHSYYPDNICTDLLLVPDEATAAIFKRYGFRVVVRANEWLLYCNTTASLSAFLAYITQATGQTSFVFGLKSRTMDFPNFTDMPMSGETGFAFDSSDILPSETADSVVLQPRLIKQVQPSFLGSVALRFADVTASDVAVPRHYNIRFAARATQWQYYVINKNGLNLSSPAIRGKQAIRFTDAQSVNLATGDTALFFSSGDALLPLSKVPQYQFDLVNDQGVAGSRAKVIVKGLPNPATSFIEAVTISGKSQAASPMYVYV